MGLLLGSSEWMIRNSGNMVGCPACGQDDIVNIGTGPICTAMISQNHGRYSHREIQLHDTAGGKRFF
jgi:hypothetical protein